MVMSAAPAAALETRGYAISYLYAASYAEDGDCPNGFNPSTTAGWINGMRALGLPEDKITSYFDGGTNMKQSERQQIGNEYISNRGRGARWAWSVWFWRQHRPGVRRRCSRPRCAALYRSGQRRTVTVSTVAQRHGTARQDINKIERICEPPNSGAMCDLLWADPVEDAQEYAALCRSTHPCCSTL